MQTKLTLKGCQREKSKRIVFQRETDRPIKKREGEKTKRIGFEKKRE